MLPIIRNRVREDSYGIARVYVRSWQYAYRGLLPDAYLDTLKESDLAERFLKNMDHENSSKSVVMIVEDSIVGVCSFGPARDDDLPAFTGEIISCYLLPEYIGLGLGSVLIGHALNELVTMGFSQCALWVLTDNRRAQKAYERLGFARDGTTKMLVIGGVTLEDTRYLRTLSDLPFIADPNQ